MSFIQNFFTSRDNNANTETYVGQTDRLWYDPDTNTLRVSDGSTPGGLPVDYSTNANASFNTITANSGTINGNLIVTGNISPATANTIGGIIPGPGVDISNQGVLTIDTANLPLSFGDFTASNNILSIVNQDEDMILQTEGNATIKLVGNVEFVATDGGGTGNVFISATNSGSMTIYAPVVPSNTAGALNIVGSANGVYQPVKAAGGMMHITGNDGVATRIVFDAFGTSAFPSVVGRAARGTANTPTPTQSGDVLFRFSALGWAEADYNTSNTGGPPTSIDFVATDNYTHSVYGSKITFYTSPQGSIGRNLSLTVDSTGATVPGLFANTANVTGNINGANINASANLVVTGTMRYDIASNNATVTQLTSKSTDVTCNGRTGQITTNNASLSQGSAVTFTVNNTFVGANDVIIVNIQSGASSNSYNITVTSVSSGQFNVQIRNFTNGALAEALVLNFAVIKVS